MDEAVLTERIYDAAITPAIWGGVLDQIIASTGAGSGLLFTPNIPPGSGGLWAHVDVAAEALAAYGAHYRFKDIWTMDGLARGLIRAGNVLPGEAILDDDRFLASEYYNDFLRPFGIGRLCTAILLDGRSMAGPATHLSLYAPPSAGPFPKESVAVLGRLLPHLQRALRLHHRLARSNGGTAWGLDLLEQVPWGAFVLGRDHRVLHVNRVGRSYLNAADGLAIIAGRLSAVRPDDNRRLAAAIAGSLSPATANGRGPGGDLTLARPSGLRPYAVSVVPLSDMGAVLTGVASCRAVVHVADPEARPVSADRRLASLFGLTPAERRLAAALLEDVGLAEYAAEHEIATSTVRTQLRSILAKTDTARQVELVNLLKSCLALPDAEALAKRKGG